MSELETSTAVPTALLDQPGILSSEAYAVSRRGITWRVRLAELRDYAGFGGSADDRLAIVQFMAALETRRIETGSLL